MLLYYQKRIVYRMQSHTKPPKVKKRNHCTRNWKGARKDYYFRLHKKRAGQRMFGMQSIWVAPPAANSIQLNSESQSKRLCTTWRKLNILPDTMLQWKKKYERQLAMWIECNWHGKKQPSPREINVMAEWGKNRLNGNCSHFPVFDGY